jgi:hypothetical protein
MILGVGNSNVATVENTGVTVTGGFEAAQPGAGANAFAAGPNAGGSTQGDSAVAIGNLAGSSSQGNDSVAVGNRAGRTTQGSYAVAVGRDAGTTSQGTDSVAVGRLAASLSQGNQSVSVGMYAGYNTQGSFAVAVGRESGGANQGDSAVAVGNSAGNSSQSVNAVAIGKAAGETGQGTNSIAIGTQAGQTDQGANGIIINSSGSSNNDTNPNHIVLVSGSGKYLLYNGTDTWKFAGGNVTVPNDNLLVGTTAPLAGGGSGGSGFGVQGTGGGTFIVSQNSSDYNMYCSKVSGNTSDNYIGFFVNGTKHGSITVDGSGVAYNVSSDERLKENVVDAPAGNIDSIKVRSFDWKADGNHQEYGFVAQELETVAPYAVTKGETDEDMWAVDYSKLVPMLVKEIQDLKAEVEALKNA